MSRLDTAAIERSLLAIILLYPEEIAEATRLSEEAFLDPRHATVFGAAMAINTAGRTDLSPETVALELERAGTLGSVGHAYIAEIVATPADPRTMRRLIETVAEESIRRRTDSAFERARSLVGDRSTPFSDTLERFRRDLSEIESSHTNDEMPHISVAGRALLRQLETGIDPGTTTGIPNLNKAIQGGIKPTQLVVVAGATGSGKTSLATVIALHAANWAALEPRKRGAVLFFSYEMAAPELMVRFVSQATNLRNAFEAPRGFSEQDMPKVIESIEKINRLPIHVEDHVAATVEAISGVVSRWSNRHGTPSLVVVDHIGLLQAPSVKGNRTEQVGAITRGLKLMAMNQRVPVLALAQLSRDVEKRDDHRPVLSDLRESGSLEQDANIVAFVYRESYYFKDREERRRVEEAGAPAMVIIAKNRSGPTAEVQLTWWGPRYLFVMPPDEYARMSMPADDYGIVEAPSTFNPADFARDDMTINAAIASLAAAVTAGEGEDGLDLPFALPDEGEPPNDSATDTGMAFLDEADRLFG